MLGEALRKCIGISRHEPRCDARGLVVILRYVPVRRGGWNILVSGVFT